LADMTTSYQMTLYFRMRHGMRCDENNISSHLVPPVYMRKELTIHHRRNGSIWAAAVFHERTKRIESFTSGHNAAAGPDSFEIMKHVETHRDGPVGCPRFSPGCKPLAACSDRRDTGRHPGTGDPFESICQKDP
jgi:hypothetical protein